MGKCDWCNAQVTETFECRSLGLRHNVCRECKTKFDAGTCRVCGGAIGTNSMNGKCLMCAQAEYVTETKQIEVENNGGDAELQSLCNEYIKFDESDYEEWMTKGYDPSKRIKTRENWLNKKLAGDPLWSPEEIDKNIADIGALMDRNLAKLLSNRYTVRKITDLDFTKPIVCEDKEGLVVLIAKSV